MKRVLILALVLLVTACAALRPEPDWSKLKEGTTRAEIEAELGRPHHCTYNRIVGGPYCVYRLSRYSEVSVHYDCEGIARRIDGTSYVDGGPAVMPVPVIVPPPAW